MTTVEQPTIAIIGSGPAGCYSAQFLRKTWPTAEMTVFEALPAPYGLIRYGIAPDHQGTKAVTSQFDRLFIRSGVRFAGNVTIGRDLSFDDVAAAFDIVVLATGLHRDRQLSIPTDPRARVIGAGSLVRSLNSHPHVLPDAVIGRGPLGDEVAVVGTGNVALDVIRLLSKEAADFSGSDVDDAALGRLRPEPVRAIQVIGRSSARAVRFDPAMLRELVALPNIEVALDTPLPDEEVGIVGILREAAVASAAGPARRTRVGFRFETEPTGITMHDGKTVLLTRDASGVDTAFAVDTVVTAIGFAPDADAHGGVDPTVPTDRWAASHVYRVGWASGSYGALPQNRSEAKNSVDAIARDVESGRVVTGRPGFSAVESRISGTVVDFDAWKRLDTFEIHQAPAQRCRRKVDDVERMIAIAHSL